MKTLKALILAALVFTTADVAAQGSLSSQVLRLLSRANTWTALQLYDAPHGGVIELYRQSVPISDRTDRLENIGGNLFFNGVVLDSSEAAGTVTSVGLDMPAVFQVAGSPVTTAGTLATTWVPVTNNYVLAGPDSADPITGDPTFRQLTTRDLPADISIDTMGTVTWDSVDKTGSSLGDLNVRSASDLSSGTLPDARFPATLPFLSGENLYSLNAMRLTIGVIPWAAFPAILPTVSGINLINLNASNISSGVVPCSYTHALNGDVISVGCDAQLAVTGVTAGTYGDATHSVTVVVDAKGRITAISENVISGFGTVDLATDVGSSILGVANGGTGMDASAAANGTLLIGNGTGFTLTTLTGTANQVGVSNASGVITLFTPQAINSTATPQFARLGLGTGAGATALITAPGQINTGYFDAGNAGVALAISWNNGMTQKVNMDANTVFTFNNPIAGVPEYRLDLVQTSGGSHTATWPGTIVWQGGMAPTLTTTAAATDICTFRWNGTAYLGDCALDFE